MESSNSQASIAKSAKEEREERTSCDNLHDPAKALCSEGNFDSSMQVEELVPANILKSEKGEKQLKLESHVEKDSFIEMYSQESSCYPPVMAPSASSTDVPVAGRVLVDYNTTDYRGFIFVLHENHGLMLLHCTRKKNKPPHWQLPGGHVDEHEFLEAGKMDYAVKEEESRLILIFVPISYSPLQLDKSMTEIPSFCLQRRLEQLANCSKKPEWTFDRSWNDCSQRLSGMQ